MAARPATPVLDRMHATHDCDGKLVTHSQLIGHFLDWLNEQGIHLARWQEEPDPGYRDVRLFTIHEGPDTLLHRYFEIDPRAEEAEKMAVLQHVREGLATALPESPSEERFAHGDA